MPQAELPNSFSASSTIGELREFAGFEPEERAFIERSLDIALSRGDAFKLWSRTPADQRAIRQQYLAYRELRTLRASPDATGKARSSTSSAAR